MRRFAFFLAVLLSFTSSIFESAATPVPRWSSTHDNIVIGIDSLKVGEVIYNVHFIYGDHSSVFPSGSQPTFWGDPSGAEAASIAIVDVFNQSISPVHGVLESFGDFQVPCNYAIYQGNPTLYRCRGIYSTEDEETPWYLSGSDGLLAGQPIVYATFQTSASPIPEPSTLALFAIGISSGFGFVYHRRRRLKSSVRN